MELVDFEKLLDAKLDPLKDAVIRMERITEKMAEGLILVARHDERVEHLNVEITGCKKAHDIIFSRINGIEHDRSAKVWMILMVFVGSLVSGIIGLFLGKR